MKRIFCLVLVFLLVVCSLAEAAGSPESFIFTAEGKIIKGGSVSQNGVVMVDVDSFSRLVAALGGKGSFDVAGGLMTIDFKKEMPENLSLPAAGAEPFTLVVNGRIYKTSSVKNGEMIYVPLDIPKSVLFGAGYGMNVDGGGRIAAVAPAFEKSGNQSENKQPEYSVVGEKENEPVDPATKEKIGKYMDSLRQIFREFQPDNKEKEKFGKAAESLGEPVLNGDDFKNVSKKFSKAIEKVEKLTPPDGETEKIQKQAVGVLSKMLRLLDLTSSLLDAPRNVTNPAAVTEIRELSDKITKESSDFDKSVREIRHKYRLGPP